MTILQSYNIIFCIDFYSIANIDLKYYKIHICNKHILKCNFYDEFQMLVNHLKDHKPKYELFKVTTFRSQSRFSATIFFLVEVESVIIYCIVSRGVWRTDTNQDSTPSSSCLQESRLNRHTLGRWIEADYPRGCSRSEECNQRDQSLQNNGVCGHSLNLGVMSESRIRRNHHNLLEWATAFATKPHAVYQPHPMDIGLPIISSTRMMWHVRLKCR